MIERSALSSLLPAVAVLATCAWACETADVPVFSVPRPAAAAADAGLSEAAPSKEPISAGTQQDFCAGSGPPVLVDSAADGGPVAICPDQLAQREFRYALCTCDACGSDHAIVTDAFDSSRGPYVASTATPGGSVGVNGDLHPSGPMHIGGSLWASTASTVTTSSLYVAGDLHTEGELRPAADPSVMADALSVQGDAWMAGGLQTTGGVTVKGTLHVPNGQPTDLTGPFLHGATDGSDFTVPTACDCAVEHLVDVAGVVATYEASNDDAVVSTTTSTSSGSVQTVGISPSAFGNVQTAVTQTLACGRIFLKTIVGNQAPIDLTTEGRVALFVNGDITTDDFIVHVPPGSEFDLFVAGNVTARGKFQVGDPANPARARMYVGGTSVNLAGATTLAGNLYAPHAALTLGASAPTILYGAIFALKFQGSADLTIHYDEAILTPSATPACSAPASCASSCDCAGQACSGGACGACSDSAPCCPPLVCGPSKTCVADVIAR
jgi:hypothetical protein